MFKAPNGPCYQQNSWNKTRSHRLDNCHPNSPPKKAFRSHDMAAFHFISFRTHVRVMSRTLAGIEGEN